MTITIKKTLAVLLTLVLVLSISVIPAFADNARPVTKETVSYIGADGEEHTVEAAVIDDGGQPYGTAGETGWYVIKGNVTLSGAVLFNDSEINVILADDCDCSYTQDSFCFIPTGSSAVPMNIYAQSDGAGKLTVKTRLGALYGDLNIYGGNITAEGIHADMRNGTESGTITINNGAVNVKNFYTTNLIVNGGTVNAESTSAIKGDLTINDGTVVVEAPSSYSLALSSPDGKLTINGGSVTSTGMYGLNAADLEINGGTVNATGSGTFGIFTRQSLVINGGSITVRGAHFGMGSGNGGSVGIGLKTPGASLTVNTTVYPENSFIIAEGQTLTDGVKTYSGTLTAEEFNEAMGKTLTCAHDMQWVTDTEPTCGKAGVKHGACSVCGEIQNENTAIAPTGDHVTAVVSAKEPTATEDGYTGDEVCTVCGQTVRTGEVIPATGEAQENEEQTGAVCGYCGESHNGNMFDRIIGAFHSLLLWFRALGEYFSAMSN